MKPHFFVSNGGSLYDTRDPAWASKPPLRSIFARGCSDIENVAQLKSALRYGTMTDLGGYPLYFITGDGHSLSFEAVRDNLRTVMDSVAKQWPDGWQVVAVSINFEDGELTCAHTGERIASAYAEDNE